MARISKEELDRLEQQGTDHVSLSTCFGTYEVTFYVGDQPMYASTESLNAGDVLVREIDEAERARLITESFNRSYW